MRALFFAILLVMTASVIAQSAPSSSGELKAKFLAILERQITERMMELAQQAGMPPQPEEVSMIVQTVMNEARTSYGGIIVLPESEARKLLTTGPDDKANSEAMERNLEKWKQVALPKPALLDWMQKKFAAGEMKGGWDLELMRRISAFHLRQLGMLNPYNP